MKTSRSQLIQDTFHPDGKQGQTTPTSPIPREAMLTVPLTLMTADHLIQLYMLMYSAHHPNETKLDHAFEGLTFYHSSQIAQWRIGRGAPPVDFLFKMQVSCYEWCGNLVDQWLEAQREMNK